MGFIGLAMRSFWSDPYLWVHLAGLAALPLFLGLCLIGFSIGDPFLPVWVELLLVAAVGIAPILWMQWQRPFYIFSLVAVALKPAQLTEDQRRLLTLFKFQRQRILAVLVPLALLFVLVKIYGASAIATSVVPFPVQWRGAGLLVAAIAFLGSNLFAQVPASVLSVMLHDDSTFAATHPYPLEQIRPSFSVLGLQINQILPPVIPDVQPAAIAVAPGTAAEIAPGITDEPESNSKTEAAPSTLIEVDEVETPPVTAAAEEAAVVESVAETVLPISQPEAIEAGLDANSENADVPPISQPEAIEAGLNTSPETTSPETTSPETTALEPAPPDSKPEPSTPEVSAPGEDDWED